MPPTPARTPRCEARNTAALRCVLDVHDTGDHRDRHSHTWPQSPAATIDPATGAITGYIPDPWQPVLAATRAIRDSGATAQAREALAGWYAFVEAGPDTSPDYTARRGDHAAFLATALSALLAEIDVQAGDL